MFESQIRQRFVEDLAGVKIFVRVLFLASLRG